MRQVRVYYTTVTLPALKPGGTYSPTHNHDSSNYSHLPPPTCFSYEGKLVATHQPLCGLLGETDASSTVIIISTRTQPCFPLHTSSCYPNYCRSQVSLSPMPQVSAPFPGEMNTATPLNCHILLPTLPRLIRRRSLHPVIKMPVQIIAPSKHATGSNDLAALLLIKTYFHKYHLI